MSGGGRTPATRPINLGLPSGVLWAEANVGAREDIDSGLYFSYGNTNGHIPGDGYVFDEETYLSSEGANVTGDIDLEHDAARLSLGGNWRMPTREDAAELIANTTQLWTQKKGVRGILFTSTVNGNTLFIPAGGYLEDVRFRFAGTTGRGWLSDGTSESAGYVLRVQSTGANVASSIARYLGVNVRAVRDD